MNLQEEVMGIILKIDQYSTTRSLQDMALIRRRITVLHRTYPAAAKVLWDIALKVQRDLMASDEVPA